MASGDMTVYVKLDEKTMQVMQSLRKEIKGLEDELAEMHQRVKRLESLPGVADALKVTEYGD